MQLFLSASCRGKKPLDISAPKAPPPKPAKSGSKDFWEL
jgi:hypothetical protein